MPKAVKTTTTPVPLPGRRRLGAGLLAIATGSVLTSGIAAGAAASVTDLPPAEPDAELIGICQEIIRLKHAHFAIYDGPNAIADDDAADAASIPIHARNSVLLDAMERIHAVSPAGIVARAQALSAHNSNFVFSFDYPDCMSGRMLSYLMRDAEIIGGSASV